MNSFRTEADSLVELSRFPELLESQRHIPISFLQHKVPKIRRDDFAMVSWLPDPELEWCPPGHGDLYPSLVDTGILDLLLSKGFRYAFVSNADNLGASVDATILGYMKSKDIPFLMECADRTLADRKGGHLARAVNGQLTLREVAQCPSSDMDSFQDVSRYCFFNTNSLWFDLRALAKKLEEHDGIMPLPLIRNLKRVDPTDVTSPEVYQLETAMGSAISCFDRAEAVRVQRNRFAPVKKTDDLLVLWSDCFILTIEGDIVPNPAREFGPIVVNLDADFYMRVDQFRERFPHGAPSLKDCSSLVVKGDVLFGKRVILKGNVSIENNSKQQLVIPDDAVIVG
jgi:UTP--glucose-1-phosphate uridylyltransferase